MTALAQHQSANSTKLLLIGQGGSGKTGALASLAHAGYNLRILDYDNGLDVLRALLTDPKSPYEPSSINRVHFKTLSEPLRNVGGKMVPARAFVWNETIRLLSHWKTDDEDFGPLETWTAQDVLVIDSLTFLAKAAVTQHLSMNAALGKTRTSMEHMRDIGGAQQLLAQLLDSVCGANLKCNLVVLSHITYVSADGGAGGIDDTGPKEGHPSAIGKALSPHISTWFNSLLHMKTVGIGASARRRIFTQSQGTVATKSSAPLAVQPSYDVSMGLAEYFTAVRGASAAPPLPTAQPAAS